MIIPGVSGLIRARTDRCRNGQMPEQTGAGTVRCRNRQEPEQSGAGTVRERNGHITDLI